MATREGRNVQVRARGGSGESGAPLLHKRACLMYAFMYLYVFRGSEQRCVAGCALGTEAGR